MHARKSLKNSIGVEAQGAQSAPRRGTVIVIVTILVALLALGGYTFSQFMVVETQAASAFGREAQARALADSGVELAAAMLLDRGEIDPQQLYNDAEAFQGLTLRDSNSPRGRGKVSVVAAVEYDSSGSSLRFGLVDESSRINLNNLEKLEVDDAQKRTLLMGLPLMTEQIADAILDFLDSDQTPRELGAEDEYYGQFGISARNGPLESIDELLLVRDVTPQLLYGEDANRNGLLDPNENDGDKSPPFDNADGTLFPGWVQYFTLHSQELNVQLDGTTRIDVNMNALGDLYDKIEPLLGQQAAAFIVAYRVAGPYQDPTTQSTASGTQMASAGGSGGTGSGSGGSPSGSGGSASGGSGSGGTGGSGSKGGSSGARSGGGGSSGTGSVGSGGGNTGASGSSGSRGSSGGSSSSGGATTVTPSGGTGANTTKARQVGGQVANSAQITKSQQVGAQAGQQTAGSISSNRNTAVQAATTAANAMFSASGKVTRAGIDLTDGAKFQLTSLYELIGVSVQIQVDGNNSMLDSPWTADGSSMRGYLPKLFDTLAVNTERIIPARININQARRETLLSIPGITEQMADRIVSQQATLLSAGSGSSDLATTGWLYIHQIADLPTLAQLDKYITTRGDVYRVQSVGYFEEGGVMARVEAVIDATSRPPQIVLQRDLTNLGAAYSQAVLSAGGP